MWSFGEAWRGGTSFQVGQPAQHTASHQACFRIRVHDRMKPKKGLLMRWYADACSTRECQLDT